MSLRNRPISYYYSYSLRVLYSTSSVTRISDLFRTYSLRNLLVYDEVNARSVCCFCRWNSLPDDLLDPAVDSDYFDES